MARLSMRTPFARSFSSTSRANTAGTVAKLTVVGRLSSQPELVTANSGREYIKYSIATTHGGQANQRTSWWNVSGFVEEGNNRDRILGIPKG